ncbi:MAG: 16S rRNA (guanine(527)-N(7))-methyltransferase RsmG [Chloroflexia bacterium]|nr:16S rRNA (guanine(527)-N(7))-methyltransferase RsmG [Chloroflexia bacterium]
MIDDVAEKMLVTQADAWGLCLDLKQLTLFRLYAETLAQWNTHTNLTAITDRQQIYLRHFLDALALARFCGTSPSALVDIGSGAGLPGVPLKILFPELELVLIDSVAKKTTFLKHLIMELGLEQVRIVTERVEAFARIPYERERYPVVTARAVADLRVLAEYALPLLAPGGRLLAPKGADPQAEVEAAIPVFAMLGGRFHSIEPVLLPGLEPRSVVLIEKIAPTDRRYPRPVGTPTRKPLTG